MDLSSREGRRQQGERIKLAAKEAGLTLDELARAIGCSRALIFQYASGASLAQSDRLQQIASAVHKPLFWFFLSEGEEAPATDEVEEAHGAEREKLEEERAILVAERARIELRRIRDDVERLEALLTAVSSPIDHRKIAECCQQLQQLLAIEVRDDPERLAGVMLKYGNALLNLQEWGAAKEKLEQAAALYTRANRPALTRDCLQSLGHANLMQGRVEEALTHFTEVAESDDWTNRWQGTLSIGAANEMLGNYPAAIASFEAALAVVEERASAISSANPGPEDDLDVARLYIEANWSNLEIDFGDYRHALDRAMRCVRLAQRHGIQDQYIEALLTTGVANLHLGRVHNAIGLIQQAHDVSLLIGDRQHQSLSLACLAMCQAARRRPELAIGRGKEALATALRCGAIRAELLAQRALCEAYLVSSNPSEALYHAEQGHALAGGSRMHTMLLQFAALRARSLYAIGQKEDALNLAGATLESAASSEIGPLQAECLALIAIAELEAASYEQAAETAAAGGAIVRLMEQKSEAWRFAAISAIAGSRKRRKTSNREALEQAVGLLNEARSLDESEGESSLMDDPVATALWQGYLQNILSSDGVEAARSTAETSDWPPLIDWLDTIPPQKGGKPNG